MNSENLPTFEDQDEFKRVNIANNLNRLLPVLPISPLVIDGEWGIGKTTFCKKLISHIKRSDPKSICIYFDAFKADHTNEPLLAFFAEIASFLPGTSAKTFKERTIPVLKVITLGIFKAAVSHFTKEYTDEVLQSVAGTAQDATTSYLNSLFDNYTKLEENIQSLKKELHKIVETNPLYIFIDELDRCRPDFSISMIEIIKHLFELDKIKFVFVANLEQIYSALHHRYGLGNADAKIYLDKFFKYQLKLPYSVKESSSDQIHNSAKYFETKLQESKYDVVKKISEYGNMRDFFENIITKNHLSLRDVEKLILYLEIDHILNNEAKYIHNEHLYMRFFCIYLIATNNKIYKEVESGEINGMDICKALGVDPNTLKSKTDKLNINEDLAYFFLCNSRGHEFTNLNVNSDFEMDIKECINAFKSNLRRLTLMNQIK